MSRKSHPSVFLNGIIEEVWGLISSKMFLNFKRYCVVWNIKNASYDNCFTIEKVDFLSKLMLITDENDEKRNLTRKMLNGI